MGNQDCNCRKHDRCKDDHCKRDISCESVLSGSFTTITGVVFSATMRATGTGKDCESARKNSKRNIEKTLENFLNCYKPEIIKETHTIKTSCEGCHEPIPPIPPTPTPSDATVILDLDYVAEIKQIGDTDFYNAYFKIGEGVGVPKSFLESTILNINIGNVVDRPLGIPIMTSDFGFNFYPVPVKGTVIYDNDPKPVSINGVVKPDKFPPLADSALRSGVMILDGFTNPKWTGRVNMDNLIQVDDPTIKSPFISVGNKFTFAFDNPFLLLGSFDQKPKPNKRYGTDDVLASTIIKTGKAKFEFRIISVEPNNDTREL
jgi:hypothetical protein